MTQRQERRHAAQLMQRFIWCTTRGNEMKHNPPPELCREMAYVLFRVRHQCGFAWRKRLELLALEDAVADSKTHDEMNTALKAWADLMLACVRAR